MIAGGVPRLRIVRYVQYCVRFERVGSPSRTQVSNARVNVFATYNVTRYTQRVLQSFGDKTTERVWYREQVRSFDSDLLRSAVRKLLVLDAADDLQDLKVPPGNRLEKLRGDRAGQHSIRINQQWRICFRWTAAGPEDVSIVDYH